MMRGLAKLVLALAALACVLLAATFVFPPDRAAAPVAEKAAPVTSLPAPTAVPTSEPTPTPSPSPTPAPSPTPTLAERTLTGLSLEEKVGQLFVLRPEDLWTAQYEGPITDWSGYSQTELTDAMCRGLEAYPVGGIALFGPNLSSSQQLTALIDGLQAASKTPLFISVDEEGGTVARLAGSGLFDVPWVGSMENVGAAGDPEKAREAGRTIGTYLARYGFNLDFAPVADVNTNPNNVVIGSRAFGSDPALVAKMVPAFLQGLHEAGVMGCVKHFPGHGDTSGDTHEGYVSVSRTWDELLQCELIPFKAALDETDLVMAAHITVPSVTDDGLPASLSQEMLTGKLRGELGYEGVVITDSLGMGAVADNYAAGEAAKLAFKAGADILLLPENPVEAFNAVLEAVRTGEIPQERLDESVLRILTLKGAYGLLG